MNKKLFFTPLLIIIIALLMVGAAAAQEPITATITNDTTALTVGDPVNLTVAVNHPAGYHVIMPELEPAWGEFVIKSQTPAVTVDNGNGAQTTSWVIDARLFAPGDYATPPLSLTITDGSGQLSEVSAASIPVTIQSVLVEGDTNLRDIKPQAEMPFINWLPWILGGLLLAVSVGGAGWWWKRRQARLALAAIDNRRPHEIALDELDRIEQMGLAANGRFKEHYTLVSDTIRRYMEHTVNVPVMERTTGEIQKSLRTAKVDLNVAQQFIAFLNESDLIKFSTFKPDVDSANQLIAQARHIVAATTPIVISPADIDRQDKQTPASPTGGTRFSANGQLKKAEVSA